MIEKVNWGIIGCGNVTELKSGPAFNKVEHSQLVAVMRRNAALAEDYAKRHQVPRFYVDADELINDPEVNAVYVATPPDTHAMYAIKAMRAGKPVYVEKPMARTYAECQEMIRVSEETGMPLYVAYYRRTLPAFLKVKEMVDEGAIGKVLTVNIRLHKAFGEKDQDLVQQSWHVNPEIAGAGHFYDLASHQLDYLDFVLGEITEVNGIAENMAGFYKAEDTVSAVFTFDSGVTGTGSWCFVVDKNSEEDKIEIFGTKGKISFPCFDKGDVEVATRQGKTNYQFQNHENISFYLVEQVVGALRVENACISTMQTAARTNFIMEEIVKSYYSKN
ncbi:MAG: Gfo/Idh/MocA family oxidoreductase [Paludibacter sp.]|nr:Gfo/Idh/MocA family oxidoreductase [Paludibacter sp.]